MTDIRSFHGRGNSKLNRNESAAASLKAVRTAFLCTPRSSPSRPIRQARCSQAMRILHAAAFPYLRISGC